MTQLEPSALYARLTPSYIREILKAATNPNMISFAGGLPGEELFPHSLLRQAFADAASEVEHFQYGLTEGEPSLREWLHRNHDLSPCEDVLITTGSQQGLDLIARAYLNPGDKVLVEAPCYLGALQVFQLAGAEVITIDQCPDGPDIDQLSNAIRRHSPKLFYAVPDFHNLSGVCWSEQKRRDVATLLNKSPMGFIEDAPYRDIRYDKRVLPFVTSLIDDHWFRLGSFSKVLAPSLRVGYVCGSSALIRPLAVIKQASDLHSARLPQLAVLRTQQDATFAGHLQYLKSAYRERRGSMVTALRTYLGDELNFDVPCGGMFIWARLKKAEAGELAAMALKNGVAVVPSSAFYPLNSRHPAALRLNFSHSKHEGILAGVKRLATAFSAL